MKPLKETKVYMPVQSDELSICTLNKEGEWKYQNVDVKEQTGYFLTKQGMEELLKKLWDEGWDSYHNETGLQHPNITRDVYINKLLNNE